jgi:hypothetical protein
MQRPDGEKRHGQAWRAALTHCPVGHPYDGDNLYVSPSGFRGCRQCRHDQKVQSKTRVKAALFGSQGGSDEPPDS